MRLVSAPASRPRPPLKASLELFGLLGPLYLFNEAQLLKSYYIGPSLEKNRTIIEMQCFSAHIREKKI